MNKHAARAVQQMIRFIQEVRHLLFTHHYSSGKVIRKYFFDNSGGLTTLRLHYAKQRMQCTYDYMGCRSYMKVTTSGSATVCRQARARRAALNQPGTHEKHLRSPDGIDDAQAHIRMMIIIRIYDIFLETMQKHTEVHNGKNTPYPIPLF